MAADTETARNIHVRISTSGVLSVAVISSCDGSMMAREFTMAVRATLHFTEACEWKISFSITA
jgi:hypothetical protein